MFKSVTQSLLRHSAWWSHCVWNLVQWSSSPTTLSWQTETRTTWVHSKLLVTCLASFPGSALGWGLGMRLQHSIQCSSKNCCSNPLIPGWLLCPLIPSQVRDPPPEGELFIYGVHLWGCGFEKLATLELQDIPPKSQVPTPLPLLHLSVAPKTEQQLSSGLSGDSSKGPFVFQCPCFVSNATRSQNGSALFTIEVSSSDVSPQKWATRNLACTLRPFWTCAVL